MDIYNKLYRKFLVFRKEVADKYLDKIYHRFPMDADEMTRLGGWLCFLSALCILAGYMVAAFVLLLLGLLTDTLDGVYARKQGKSSPQTDWAMDRFTEAILCSALLIATQGNLISVIFMIIFILNNFLPYKKIPVLILRHSLLVYLLFLF